MSTVLQAPSVSAIKNVLFATDFSDCAGSAMPTAIGIAQRFQSQVHIVHALGRESAGHFAKPPANQQVQCEQALEHLQNLSRNGSFKNTLFHLIVQPGDVTAVVLQFIRDLNIDLVVLGTHGQRSVRKLFLGSVADEIMQRANCPVLTVGPNLLKVGLEKGIVRRIVCATRFPQHPHRAMDMAMTLAREYGSMVIAFHAIANDADAVVTNMEEAIARTEIIPGVEHVVARKYGSAVEGILDVAHERGADLIVMGAPSRALLEAPWSTTRRVVANAECPVLTVKRKPK